MLATTPSGEPGEVFVGERFDVLDAVPDARGGTCRAIDVEREAHGAVADRVRHALEAAAGEAGDDLGEPLRVRPERVGSPSGGVRCEQPCRPGLDDAVDEELRAPAAPAAAVRAEERQSALDLVVGDRRFLVQGHDETHAQPAPVFELAAGVEERGPPSITWAPVRPTCVHLAERVAVGGEQLLLAALGDDVEHDRDRRLLAQLAGRPAVDADDLGALPEAARPVDTRCGERRGARERCVEIEEGEESRRARDRVVDRRRGDTHLVEHLVGECVAEHPLLIAAARALRRRASRTSSSVRSR